MRNSLWVLALIAACPPGHAHESIAAARRLDFPKLADGRFVLPVDLHTHTVFSDGAVWPDIRVREAERDALFAVAVTEHLEPKGQKHRADIPHRNRNRSFEIAAAAANEPTTGSTGSSVKVINGAEITKAMPPGHMNAVFLRDANALLSDDPDQQLAAARSQGAFVFWNHPFFWEDKPDGIAQLFPMHRDWIARGMIHGVEVANGIDASDAAFQIALDNNLAILGVSDTHGLIDWEYQLERGQKRTVTLVLSQEPTLDGVKRALFAGQTVALENDTLIGRPEHVEAVVAGALRLETGKYMPNSTVVSARIVNASPIQFILENIGKEHLYQGTNVWIIPPRSSYDLMISDVPDVRSLGLSLRVVNAHVAPRRSLEIRLTPHPAPE